MNKIIIAIIVSTFIAACGSSDDDVAQPITEPAATGSAQGVVTNLVTGALIDGASIVLNDMVTMTNVDGIYIINDIPLGQKNITVSKIGYKNHVSTIEIMESVTTTFDVSLEKFIGGIIDFELVSGVVPVEGLEIAQQFEDTHGITFSLDDGANPVIAMVGGNTASAFGAAFGNDTAAPAESTGEYFSTDDGVLSGLSTPSLIVVYDPPAKGAGGIILDIDFDEMFKITAYDADGNNIKEITINAGDSDTGDGIGTDWNITSDTRNISKIIFVGTRQASGAFGLGFDNFLARTN